MKKLIYLLIFGAAAYVIYQQIQDKNSSTRKAMNAVESEVKDVTQGMANAPKKAKIKVNEAMEKSQARIDQGLENATQ